MTIKNQTIPDQLESQRQQRAKDMAAVQGREPVGLDPTPQQQYVLHTYELSGDVHHIYATTADGSPLDQATAEAAGGRLKSQFDANASNTYNEFTVQVLQLEALPS